MFKNKKLFYAVLAVGFLVVGSLVFIYLSLDWGSGGGGKCVIADCHGLNVECGPEGPAICTMAYEAGDNCRRYAQCRVTGGQCQLVESEKFKTCKSCFEKCWGDFDPDSLEVFDCEEQCEQY